VPVGDTQGCAGSERHLPAGTTRRRATENASSASTGASPTCSCWCSSSAPSRP